MEKKIDIEFLYELQDQVLSVIFSLKNSFYLTGGTALHRFYYNIRHSDDLDLFTLKDQLFHESVKEIIDELSNKFDCQTIVHAKDFYRLFINDVLQVDLVNDYAYRYGTSALIKNYRIDNVMNILTNKICTILDRDEEKDVVDLFSIAKHTTFEWQTVLEIADKKSPVDKAVLIERLQTFPLEWLKNIKFIKPFTITKSMIDQLCEDILNGSINSLTNKNV